MQKAPQLIGLWSPAPGCGKSTVAEHIWRTKHAQIMPFAYTLKRMLDPVLISAGYSDVERAHYLFSPEGKHKPLERLPGSPTPRRLMQTLGTEWGRFCVHGELWVELWRSRVKTADRDYVIVDDVRFHNEAMAVRSLGGQLWCIKSSRVITSTEHISEGQLGDQPFDVILQNDGTIEQLHAAVDCVLA